MSGYFRWTAWLVVGLMLAGCGAPTLTPSAAPPTAAPPTAAPTEPPTPTSAPTDTPVPTETPAPTATAEPTVSPIVVGPVSSLPVGTDGNPWWNDTVFYEIFVRSFSDSDGDGKGDLQGLIEKLDYLNDGDPATRTDLGVTGLWLMPIFESPSYHGYDVTDFYTVNPDYGTNDDFKQLMAEAHARGIRVIIDFVLNHTSNRHPWFQDAQTPGSPHRDWYIWKEQSPGYAGLWGQSVWHYAGSTSGYYYGVFVAGMPDLNYANPDVGQQMNDVARFWIREMGADGFRLDGARYLVEEDRNLADTAATHQWYQGFRSFYKEIDPEAITVGEVWTASEAVARYVQGDELDLAFNFDMAGGFVKAARDGSAMEARTQLLLAGRFFKPGQFATFLSNHDQERVMTQLGGEADRARHAAALLLTAPGVPFLYYGEEIGMKGAKPDEKIRAPMQWSADANAGFSVGAPWQAPNSDYETRNVAAQSDDAASLWSLYRDLIRLRSEHAALRLGEAVVVQPDHPGVYALLRATPLETILVVINLTAEPVNDYQLSLETGPLTGKYAVAPLLGEGAFYAPAVNAQGGFEMYKPLPALDANGIYILQLQGK